MDYVERPENGSIPVFIGLWHKGCTRRIGERTGSLKYRWKFGMNGMERLMHYADVNASYVTEAKKATPSTEGMAIQHKPRMEHGKNAPWKNRN